MTQNNKATGGWWLYKWYGELTGHTLNVTPPNANAKGLQCLAAVDSSKKQVRVIFGGSTGGTSIVLKGMGSTSYFGGTVHATVCGVDQTGLNPSNGPVFESEGDYTVANGQISVPVSAMSATSAYLLMVTPNTSQSPATSDLRFEAEYARLSDGAMVASTTGRYSGTGYVDAGSASAGTHFVVTAATDG